MRKLIILVLFLIGASPVFATDYYVATTGSGTTCSFASPCLTVQTVIDNKTLAGGDNIYIRSGTYVITSAIVITSADDGSAGNYVTFSNYQNEDVTISTASHINMIEIGDTLNIVQYVKWDGSGSDVGHHIVFDGGDAAYNIIKVIGGDHIWLKNLEIRNNNYQVYQGIKLEGITAENLGNASTEDGPKACIVEYCLIHGINYYGVKLSGYGADNNIIRYNIIYNTITAGANGISASGQGFEANPPNGNSFYNNTIYNCAGNGIALNSMVGNLVYNNTIYNNTGWESGNRGIQLVTSCNSNSVYGNTVYGNKYYGIEIAQTSNSNVIYNNVVYNNLTDYNSSTYSEIMIQSSSASNLIYNNAIIPNSATANSGIKIESDAGDGNLIKNNIVYIGGTGYAFSELLASNSITVQNNDFYKAADTAVYLDGATRTIAYLNDTWTGTADGNIIENPAWDASYKLTSSSPQGTGHVRDGGLDLSATFTTDKDGIPRPQGPAWDMGAFEWTPPALQGITGQGFSFR
jgi:parallel beta-helix repeat protein